MTAPLDVNLGNGVLLKLVRIEPGKFLMGSSKREQDYVRDNDQSPGAGSLDLSAEEKQHEVEITQPFYLGVYPVTQAEYEQVMGNNPSWFSRTGGGKEVVAGRELSSLAQTLSAISGAEVGDTSAVELDPSRFPVESVNWNDALEFCRQLSQKVGKTFDLPTEAEWEYACRAGSTGLFHPGNSLSSRQANIVPGFTLEGEMDGPTLGRTTQVGSYEPNAFGLYDMHGNIYEWCKDWFSEEYYSESAAQNPQGPTTGYHRVLRGGSWSAVAAWCRSAARTHSDPEDRNDGFGFRVVCRIP